MAKREYVGEWKHTPLPIPEPQGKVSGVKLPNGKCTIDGEQIIVKLQILPVDGSVVEHVTGEFKGGTIKNPDRTGDCPACDAHVPLSSKGFVTSHVVKGGTAEPNSVLTEPQVDPTDAGSRVGDPRSAMQRRTVELGGAFEHGMVKVPVPGKNGRIKLEEAPATEENVKAALAYWVARKPRSEAARAAQNENVSSLTRRLEAMRQASVVVHAPVDAPVTTELETRPAPCVTTMHAEESPEGLTSPSAPISPIGTRFKAVGMSPGPALVKGRSERPLAGEVTVRQQGEPFVAPESPEDTRKHGDTWTTPMGRERMDKESSTVEMVGGRYGYLTQPQFDALGCDHRPLPFGVTCDSPDCARKFRTRSNKYWRRIRQQEKYAREHRRDLKPRVAVKLGTAGMGTKSLGEDDPRDAVRYNTQAPRS